LAPPYYSQRSAFASPLSAFFIAVSNEIDDNVVAGYALVGATENPGPGKCRTLKMIDRNPMHKKLRIIYSKTQS